MSRPLRARALGELVVRCRDEARQKQRNGAPDACYELLCRALVARDSAAWRAVVEQYLPLVRRWLYQAAPGVLTGADVDELAHRALARFWRTLSERDRPLGQQFPHTGALLRYLQQCTLSTLYDQQRRWLRQTRLEERLATYRPVGSGPSLEDRVAERIDRAQQVARVRAWAARHVTADEERLVLELSFNRGLSPQEIARRYGDVFANARAVRRVKERLLKRLRRAFDG